MTLNQTYAMQNGKAMPAEAKATKPAATSKLRARAMDSKFANPKRIF